LHRDRGIDLIRLQLPVQVSRQKIPLEHSHRVRNPAVPRGFVPPEVLVGVDLHADPQQPRSDARMLPTAQDGCASRSEIEPQRGERVICIQSLQRGIKDTIPQS